MKVLLILILSIIPTISYAKISVDEANIKMHFSKYGKAKLPVKNKVFVCSAYGCKTRTDFVFQKSHLQMLKKIMLYPKNATEERESLRVAISYIESIVGPATGTSTDRPSIGVFGNGDNSQLDCVDEATNVTSYLMVLNYNNLLKFHDIESPNWKGGIFKWTHYAAVIKDKRTGIDWAIDAGVGKNGDRPLIVEYSKWYN